MAVGNLTGYLQDAALKHLLGQATYVPPVHLYLGLYTVAPTKTTPGVEVSGAGYPGSRPEITFVAVSAGTTTNVDAITFGPAGAGGWGSVVGIAILDTDILGNSTNELWFGALYVPRTINSGDSLEFASNAITINLG